MPWNYRETLESADIATEPRVLVSRTEPIHDCLVKVEVKTGRQSHACRREPEDRLAGRLWVRVAVALVPQGSLPRTEGKTRRLERVSQAELLRDDPRQGDQAN